MTRRARWDSGGDQDLRTADYIAWGAEQGALREAAGSDVSVEMREATSAWRGEHRPLR